ncbi:hypothetical protein [Prevotella sp. HUN102]|uniref:hypothetical protein n=1 Tax=Prevotella sp. HUN102 TaxID=1392486 RepID=UPI00048E503A|nr:hypothetical protein [Prevotella sp. HUN102]
MGNNQELVAEQGNISDSNNSNEGNAGRDILNNYTDKNAVNMEIHSSQDEVIKGLKSVILGLQHQIDRMQDQMEVYQKQFTKAQELKEKLMDMLLEDRKLLQKKLEGLN